MEKKPTFGKRYPFTAFGLAFLALTLCFLSIQSTAAQTPPPQSTNTVLLHPVLSINIPDITLENVSVNKTSGAGFVDIPWIGDYVTGAYKYAVGVAAILAAVMFILGGFQYLTAGGDKGRVDKGKKRIVDAVVGMLLILGAYLMLTIINPDLVTYPAIRIPLVARKVFEVISEKNMVAATGKPSLASSAMMKLATDKAKAVGGVGLSCFVYASMVHESGGKQNALGHDENAATTVFSVQARRTFINSGKFYSGDTFPPAGCGDKSCQNQGPVNDDKGTFDVTKPPDYGLDWRYSHGIGAGQSTIFPNSAPCPGREDQGRAFRSGGKCFTIPDLLDPDKQADAMVSHYQYCWGKTNNGADPDLGYVCYAGTIARDNPIILSRVAVFNKCMADNQGQ